MADQSIEGTGTVNIEPKTIRPGAKRALLLPNLLLALALGLLAPSPAPAAAELEVSQVKDVWPGSNGGSGGNGVAVNDKLIFNGNNGVNGIEPWVSDGTDAGTFMLRNVVPDGSLPGSSIPEDLAAMNGRVYFRANEGSAVGSRGSELAVKAPIKVVATGDAANSQDEKRVVALR